MASVNADYSVTEILGAGTFGDAFRANVLSNVDKLLGSQSQRHSLPSKARRIPSTSVVLKKSLVARQKDTDDDSEKTIWLRSDGAAAGKIKGNVAYSREEDVSRQLGQRYDVVEAVVAERSIRKGLIQVPLGAATAGARAGGGDGSSSSSSSLAAASASLASGNQLQLAARRLPGPSLPLIPSLYESFLCYDGSGSSNGSDSRAVREKKGVISLVTVSEPWGRDMEHWIRKKRGIFMRDEARRCVVRQILRLLADLHDRGFMHRDLKFSNILVAESGVTGYPLVRLCDMGSCRRVPTSPSELATPYVTSRFYRPPELLLGSCNYGTAVDVWAIATTIAEFFMQMAVLQDFQRGGLGTNGPAFLAIAAGRGDGRKDADLEERYDAYQCQLFPGCATDAHQILHIMNLLGVPTDSDIAGMCIPDYAADWMRTMRLWVRTCATLETAGRLDLLNRYIAATTPQHLQVADGCAAHLNWKPPPKPQKKMAAVPEATVPATADAAAAVDAAAGAVPPAAEAAPAAPVAPPPAKRPPMPDPPLIMRKEYQDVTEHKVRLAAQWETMKNKQIERHNAMVRAAEAEAKTKLEQQEEQKQQQQHGDAAAVPPATATSTTAASGITGSSRKRGREDEEVATMAAEGTAGQVPGLGAGGHGDAGAGGAGGGGVGAGGGINHAKQEVSMQSDAANSGGAAGTDVDVTEADLGPVTDDAYDRDIAMQRWINKMLIRAKGAGATGMQLESDGDEYHPTHGRVNYHYSFGLSADTWPTQQDKNIMAAAAAVAPQQGNASSSSSSTTISSSGSPYSRDPALHLEIAECAYRLSYGIPQATIQHQQHQQLQGQQGQNQPTGAGTSSSNASSSSSFPFFAASSSVAVPTYSSQFEIPLVHVGPINLKQFLINRYVPADVADMVASMLHWDPRKRLSCAEALRHPAMVQAPYVPALMRTMMKDFQDYQQQQWQQQQQPTAVASAHTAGGNVVNPDVAPPTFTEYHQWRQGQRLKQQQEEELRWQQQQDEEMQQRQEQMRRQQLEQQLEESQEQKRRKQDDGVGQTRPESASAAPGAAQIPVVRRIVAIAPAPVKGNAARAVAGGASPRIVDAADAAVTAPVINVIDGGGGHHGVTDHQGQGGVDNAMDGTPGPVRKPTLHTRAVHLNTAAGAKAGTGAGNGARAGGSDGAAHGSGLEHEAGDMVDDSGELDGAHETLDHEHVLNTTMAMGSQQQPYLASQQQQAQQVQQQHVQHHDSQGIAGAGCDNINTILGDLLRDDDVMAEYGADGIDMEQVLEEHSFGFDGPEEETEVDDGADDAEAAGSDEDGDDDQDRHSVSDGTPVATAHVHMRTGIAAVAAAAVGGGGAMSTSSTGGRHVFFRPAPAVGALQVSAAAAAPAMEGSGYHHVHRHRHGQFGLHDDDDATTLNDTMVITGDGVTMTMAPAAVGEDDGSGLLQVNEGQTRHRDGQGRADSVGMDQHQQHHGAGDAGTGASSDATSYRQQRQRQQVYAPMPAADIETALVQLQPSPIGIASPDDEDSDINDNDGVFLGVRTNYAAGGGAVNGGGVWNGPAAVESPPATSAGLDQSMMPVAGSTSHVQFQQLRQLPGFGGHHTRHHSIGSISSGSVRLRGVLGRAHALGRNPDDAIAEEENEEEEDDDDNEDEVAGYDPQDESLLNLDQKDEDDGSGDAAAAAAGGAMTNDNHAVAAPAAEGAAVHMSGWFGGMLVRLVPQQLSNMLMR